MTADEQKTAQEITGILKQALDQLHGFYDGRVILCVLIGAVTAYAGVILRAGAYTEEEIYNLFGQGLVDALEGANDVPAPAIISKPMSRRKQ